MALLNRLTKREFFRVILGAIAAGTLCTSPAVADALAQVEPNPIAEVVRQARAMLPIQQRLNAAIETKRPTAALRVEQGINISALCQYMAEHFRPNTTATEEIRLLLNNPTALGISSDLLDEAELARLTEGLIPVAVMCELIKRHCVRFHVKSAAPGFEMFARDYQDMILAA